MPSYDPGDGHPLHYADAGSGRPVVLLHGWACHGGYFERQVEALADRFRLIVPDLRGHRQSHRPGDAPNLATLATDLNALISHLGLTAPVLVGWSMGALVAFEFVRRFGCFGIGGLAVIDMTPRVVNDADWRLGLIGGYSAAQAERGPELIRKDWTRWVEAFLPTVFAGGGAPSPALTDWIRGQMQGCDPDTMAALWSAITTADYRADMAEIAVPTLILRGGASQLYGPETAAWLESAIPDPTAVTIPDAGHAPHMERPAAFNAALTDFLDRI